MLDFAGCCGIRCGFVFCYSVERIKKYPDSLPNSVVVVSTDSLQIYCFVLWIADSKLSVFAGCPGKEGRVSGKKRLRIEKHPDK